MKKVFFAALAVAASVSFVNAQDATVASNDNAANTSVVQEERTKIKTTELPESITKVLAGDDYKGWTADTAYQLNPSGTYEVTLKKGAESKTVKFDKDGNKIG